MLRCSNVIASRIRVFWQGRLISDVQDVITINLAMARKGWAFGKCVDDQPRHSSSLYEAALPTRGKRCFSFARPFGEHVA